MTRQRTPSALTLRTRAFRRVEQARQDLAILDAYRMREQEKYEKKRDVFRAELAEAEAAFAELAGGDDEAPDNAR